jgi:hypothetical protein
MGEVLINENKSHYFSLANVSSRLVLAGGVVAVAVVAGDIGSLWAAVWGCWLCCWEAVVAVASIRVGWAVVAVSLNLQL